MHIYDNLLRHSGLVGYRITERLIIESLISDHGIDFRSGKCANQSTRAIDGVLRSTVPHSFPTKCHLSVVCTALLSNDVLSNSTLPSIQQMQLAQSKVQLQSSLCQNVDLLCHALRHAPLKVNIDSYSMPIISK